MTFWLVSTSQAQGEFPELAPYISMPDYNDRDWSRAKSKQDIKRILRSDDPSAPPEHIDLIAQTIWRFVHKIEQEDIMCLVQKTNHKPSNVYFAEVVGQVEYNYEQSSHLLPVRWFEETGSMLRLWPYRPQLADADIWPQAIGNKKLNLALRNHLPLPGNRFANWVLIILIIFVAVKLTRMLTNH